MKIFVICLLCLITSCTGRQNDNTYASRNDDVTNSAEPEDEDFKPWATGKLRRPQPEEKDISNVSLCRLLRSPEEFEQRAVRITAIFRRGFEKSEFYSLKCPSDMKVWVGGHNNKECKKGREVLETDNNGDEQTAGVVVVGWFTGKEGRYRHSGGSRYYFYISCYEKYEVLDHGNKGPQYLTPQQRRRIEKFEGLKILPARSNAVRINLTERGREVNGRLEQ